MSEKKFCSRCGAPLSPGAVFCSNCGEPVSIAQTRPEAPPPTRGYRREWREGRRRDFTGPLTGGLVLIWLGISFFLAQSGTVSWAIWWEIFLPGLGVIVIIQGLIRYAMYGIPGPLVGAIIGGGVLIAIGLAFLTGLTEFWPLVLVAIGVGIIISAALRRG